MQVKPFCVRVFKGDSLVNWFILYATDVRRARGMATRKVSEPGFRLEITAVRRGMTLGRSAGKAA
jgi:hypothetical protein